jgi:hypothetical protein
MLTAKYTVNSVADDSCPARRLIRLDNTGKWSAAKSINNIKLKFWGDIAAKYTRNQSTGLSLACL